MMGLPRHFCRRKYTSSRVLAFQIPLSIPCVISYDHKREISLLNDLRKIIKLILEGIVGGN